MKNLIKNLGHERLWVRTGYAFMFFFTFLALAYAFGLLFLPEGIMKELPLPAYGIRRKRIFPFFLH
ncbi:MAG: hypothetical protein DRO00_07055 [Thermoproteota archaeon]|nr:MAG: hypothetical protein DRO00_07055 [Candidatus Korarchaeota archaeon]